MAEGSTPAEGTPAEQELLEALRQLRVSDLLVQTASTISSLAYHRLSEEARDLEQARLAIEALRALVPVLRGAVPDELVRDLDAVTANLQLAYASAVGAAQPPGGEGPADAGTQADVGPDGD